MCLPKSFDFSRKARNLDFSVKPPYFEMLAQLFKKAKIGEYLLLAVKGLILTTLGGIYVYFADEETGSVTHL